MKQNPICEQNKKDCALCVEGYCIGLEDTHFKRSCPFYKTPDQVRLEREWLSAKKMQRLAHTKYEAMKGALT